MRKRAAWIGAALAVVLVATGCPRKGPSGGPGGPRDGGRGRGDSAAPSADDNGGTGVRPEKLTETELKKHLDVLRGLQAISDEAKKDPTGLRQTAEVTAFLTSKGTTWAEFGRSHAKVITAFAAMAFRDGLAQARAEGAPPFAISMMEAAGAAYKDVPDENIELVRKYKGELENLNVKSDDSSD